jgi:hypothetical protein
MGFLLFGFGGGGKWGIVGRRSGEGEFYTDGRFELLLTLDDTCAGRRYTHLCICVLYMYSLCLIWCGSYGL